MTFSIGRLATMSLVLGLAACGSDDTDGTDTDGGGETDDTNTCSVTVVPTLPTNNATGVYYRTQFVVGFSADESTTATFELKDASGGTHAISAPTWATNGKQAAFTAVDPLEPSTGYTIEVTTSCGGDATKIAFTTGETGAALGNEDFLGGTYAIDLASATIIQPAGVNQLLGSLLGQVTQTIAVQPTEIVDGKLVFFGGLVEGGAQDVCQETIAFPEGATWEDPYFQISQPDGITLTFSGIEISLLSLELSGSFAPDASAIEGLTLDGAIDTRQLISVLGDTLGGDTGDDAVCNLLGTFTNNAVQCETCPGGGDYCLTLVAANITADELTPGIEEVTCADIEENASCTEKCPAL